MAELASTRFGTMRVRPVCLLVSLLAAGLFLAPAAAAGSCAEQIIDDWADDATIDGTYPIPCYREAIAALPEDLRAYSSAADDIQRALQARLRAEEDGGGGGSAGAGGGSGGTSGGGTSGGEPSGGGSQTPDPQPTKDGGESREPAAASPSLDSTDPAPVYVPDEESAAPAPSAAVLEQELGDGGSSLPAAVIAVLALVGLVALAGAGWLVRRQLRSG